jgi:NAD(P)H-dependent flavin oxidoreductase YrpB (nitropropane dioxygenase family)
VGVRRRLDAVKRLIEYCKLCGWALALAHAKSGDAAFMAGYLGKSESMDEAIARFAEAYAEQTERDYDALVKAAKSKRIAVAKLS